MRILSWNLWWRYGPWEHRRVAVHARIEAPGGALPVFTTHLTYGAGRSQVRTEQVRRLAAFVADHAADCAYPHFAVVADLQQEAR